MSLSTSLPQGFEIPDGAKEGTEFDTVATFIVSGGKISLKAIEGLPVGEGAESETEEAPETEAAEEQEAGEEGFMNSVERGLSAPVPA